MAKKKVRVYKMQQGGGAGQQQNIEPAILLNVVMQGFLGQYQEDNDIYPDEMYNSLVNQNIDPATADQVVKAAVQQMQEIMQQETPPPSQREGVSPEESAPVQASSNPNNIMDLIMDDDETMDDIIMADNPALADDEELETAKCGKTVSKAAFVRNVMKQAGGMSGKQRATITDTANGDRGSITPNFVQALNNTSNEAMMRSMIENQYDMLAAQNMLPMARRGREQRREDRRMKQFYKNMSRMIPAAGFYDRAQGFPNQPLNILNFTGQPGRGAQGMPMQGMGNPYGIKSIDVRRSGLFGRPRRYSMEFFPPYMHAHSVHKDRARVLPGKDSAGTTDTKKKSTPEATERKTFIPTSIDPAGTTTGNTGGGGKTGDGKTTTPPKPEDTEVGKGKGKSNPYTRNLMIGDIQYENGKPVRVRVDRMQPNTGTTADGRTVVLPGNSIRIDDSITFWGDKIDNVFATDAEGNLTFRDDVRNVFGYNPGKQSDVWKAPAKPKTPIPEGINAGMVDFLEWEKVPDTDRYFTRDEAIQYLQDRKGKKASTPSLASYAAMIANPAMAISSFFEMGGQLNKYQGTENSEVNDAPLTAEERELAKSLGINTNDIGFGGTGAYQGVRDQIKSLQLQNKRNAWIDDMMKGNYPNRGFNPSGNLNPNQRGFRPGQTVTREEIEAQGGVWDNWGGSGRGILPGDRPGIYGTQNPYPMYPPLFGGRGQNVYGRGSNGGFLNQLLYGTRTNPIIGYAGSWAQQMGPMRGADGSVYQGEHNNPYLKKIDVTRSGLFGRPKRWTATYGNANYYDPNAARENAEAITSGAGLIPSDKKATSATPSVSDMAPAGASYEDIVARETEGMTGRDKRKTKANLRRARRNDMLDYFREQEATPEETSAPMSLPTKPAELLPTAADEERDPIGYTPPIDKLPTRPAEPIEVERPEMVPLGRQGMLPPPSGFLPEPPVVIPEEFSDIYPMGQGSVDRLPTRPSGLDQAALAQYRINQMNAEMQQQDDAMMMDFYKRRYDAENMDLNAAPYNWQPGQDMLGDPNIPININTGQRSAAPSGASASKPAYTGPSYRNPQAITDRLHTINNILRGSMGYVQPWKKEALQQEMDYIQKHGRLQSSGTLEDVKKEGWIRDPRPGQGSYMISRKEYNRIIRNNPDLASRKKGGQLDMYQGMQNSEVVLGDDYETPAWQQGFWGQEYPERPGMNEEITYDITQAMEETDPVTDPVRLIGQDDEFSVDMKRRDMYNIDFPRAVQAKNLGLNMLSNFLERRDLADSRREMYQGLAAGNQPGVWNYPNERWDPNSGLIPKMGATRYVSQEGGQTVGGEVYMSDQEIRDFLSRGGELEYI